jgi:hypothetical protein
MSPQLPTQLLDDFVERSQAALEVGELRLPPSAVLRFARIEALGEEGGVEALETGLVLEPRPGLVDIDALANQEPVQIRDVAAEQSL